MITRGKGSKEEIAFLPATAPIDTQATAADNRAKGSTLSLTATGKDATVKITSSAGSSGGAPATKTVTVKAGTTLSMAPPQPAGLKGAYAVTVQRLSGGKVYASRMLALPQSGVPCSRSSRCPTTRAWWPSRRPGPTCGFSTGSPVAR